MTPSASRSPSPASPPEDLSVEVQGRPLIVAARKAAEDEGRVYLHRGIATRAFERRFAPGRPRPRDGGEP